MQDYLLKALHEEYGVNYNTRQIQHGALSDKLGKLYEKYVLEIFNDITSIKKYWDCKYPREKKIIYDFLQTLNIDFNDIEKIESSDKNLGRTEAGGSPKTDVVIDITFKNKTKRCVPISIKHSSQQKVAIAEYDVDTICNAIGVSPDSELKRLMKKHQDEKSAKNFTSEEKENLTKLIKPYKNKLIRWCLTLNAEESSGNILHPDVLIRFAVINTIYENVKIININDYIDELSNSNAGFGTGLSWTYASGSQSKKIQFKG